MSLFKFLQFKLSTFHFLQLLVIFREAFYLGFCRASTSRVSGKWTFFIFFKTSVVNEKTQDKKTARDML